MSFRGWTIEFDSPWWLLLLPLLLPPLVWASQRSLAGLGPVRRFVAIAVRTWVITLVVLALAEAKTVQRSETLTTIYLVDVSNSVPKDLQAAALGYAAETSRKRREGDMAGLIVFGTSPRVEAPPAPSELNTLKVESAVDAENTDLAAALKLALATFPQDTARRIVILSDGNENRGSLLEQARAAEALGVQVDAVPIVYSYDREVLVEKVVVPPDVKKGERVNIDVVIRASEPTRGKLQIFQTADKHRAPAAGNETPATVELARGINKFTLKQLITEPNFYTFSAEFTPEPGSGDRRAINNVAQGFTHARGKAQALLIESVKGEHAELVKALREKEIEVRVLLAPRVDGGGDIGGDAMPADLAELQPYDVVILANTPKESFTENQHQLFAANCHDMGAGLIMIGGEASFGAGGWMNTPVEKALPVDMQIKAVKVQGLGAMALIMHASEIPEGNFWQKVVAKAAINALSSYDYAGLLYWEGQEAWLFTLKPIGTGRNAMLRLIDRMTPGDMPDFDPSLIKAMRGLNAIPDAMSKHIVVISDGDPTEPTNRVIQQLAASKITVTTILTAAHGNDPRAAAMMRNLAQRTKGRFYNVTNPRALPRIYQKEARTISRPLIFERQNPWCPVLNEPITEPVSGVAGELPPITGLVLTTPKQNELVEIPIVSPLPGGQVNPVLAHWTYGLGRSVAFTSDAGRKWAKTWPSWDGFAAFWSQVVRWSMRPSERGEVTLNLRREGDRIKVVVDALDKNDRFLNFMSIQGNVIDPALKTHPVELVQTAPGRYEATIENASVSGNYFVNLGYRGLGGVQGVATSGVSVPYSDEYRELRSNPTTLETLASITDGKTIQWKLTPEGRIDVAATARGVDHFRREPELVIPRAFAPLWPVLLFLAACSFLGDVAVRRLALDIDWIRETWRARFARDPAKDGRHSAYLAQLRSTKAQADRAMERGKQTAPIEPAPGQSAPMLEDLLGTPASQREPQSSAAEPAAAPTPSQTPGYTNRLLKAKKRVWEERDKNQDRNQPET